MEWSKEEVKALMECCPAGVSPLEVFAIATRAVELVAARYRTTTVEEETATLDSIRSMDDHIADAAEAKALEHLAAQGARLAVLEAERDALKAELRQARLCIQKLRGGTRETVYSLEQQVESIRRRSLEAGNLERLIAEKGIPATMRWVVDGTHPTRCLCSAASERTDVLHMPGCPLFRGRCSPTCTHDDAASPGHPERVKERSEAFMHPNGRCTCAGEGTCRWCQRVTGEEAAIEAMRAACIRDAREWCERNGILDAWPSLFVALNGSTP